MFHLHRHVSRVMLFSAVLVALASACRSGPTTTTAAGVITEASRSTITVDGVDVLDLRPDLSVRSAYDGRLLPIIRQAGKYAQITGDGTAVFDIVVIGPVLPGNVVKYQGTLVRAADGRLEFASGTILDLAPGVPVPGLGRIVVDIDVGTDQVTAHTRSA